MILGALAGKPGVAGAGLLGMAQETVGVVWDDVRRLNIHAPARVISLMDSWHVVMRLYCTPQNYEVVLNAVQKWAAGGLKKATQAPTRQRFHPHPPVVAQIFAGRSGRLSGDRPAACGAPGSLSGRCYW